MDPRDCGVTEGSGEPVGAVSRSWVWREGERCWFLGVRKRAVGPGESRWPRPS